MDFPKHCHSILFLKNSLPASNSPRGQPRHQDNSPNEPLRVFIISQYLNPTPTFVLCLCAESAHGPTGSTGRSRTMSTSVQKTPCEPPLDLSEPRHAAQKPHPVLMFTPCPHRPNLKFSIPPTLTPRLLSRCEFQRSPGKNSGATKTAAARSSR